MPIVALISLGCAKNLVDSELILGRLAAAGYDITNDQEQAEIIIVNTCGFIGPAKEEAIAALLEAASLKKKGLCRLVVGAGCLVQRYGADLVREMPEIDLWITRGRYTEITKLIDQAGDTPGLSAFGPPEMHDDTSWPRVLSTPPHRAYLRIADGCDNRCRYCVIPDVRGAYHSRPMADLAGEAERLAENGVKEITLIAQDTTDYGHDLPDHPTLADLLRRLLAVKGPKWWRVLYSHPAKIHDELLDLLAAEDRLCPYLDLPLQHASPSVLHAMGRPDDPARLRDLLNRIRDRVPAVALRTSVIVGFPGETETDFEILRSFLAEQRFDWLGVFAYSREEGTPAADLPGQIPARIKEKRRRELLRMQQDISRCLLAARVGERREVLIEGPHPNRKGYWLARSKREAPEVDGLIHLPLAEEATGRFIPAKITGAGVYDLSAVPD